MTNAVEETVSAFRALVESKTFMIANERRRVFLRPLDYFQNKDESFSTVASINCVGPDLNAAVTLLLTAAGWKPSNPNNPNTTQAVIETYVHRVLVENSVGLRLANQYDNDGKCAFDYALESFKHIRVVGSRGAGKTAFLNYWLTVNTKSLELNGTTWFRIDAAKIYQIHSSINTFDPVELFGIYYSVHSLYVIGLYGGAMSSNLRDLINDGIKLSSSPLLENTRQQARMHQAYGKTFEAFYRSLEAFCTKRRATIRQQEDKSAYIIFEYVKELVINKKMQTQADNAIRAVQEALAEFEVKCILIIDGIDNIAWTKEDSFYTNTTKNFSRIIDRIKSRMPYNTVVVFCARPETISEIELGPTGSNPAGIPGFSQRYENLLQSPAELRIGAPDLLKIVNKKLEVARFGKSVERQRSLLFSKHVDAENAIQELIELSSNLYSQDGFRVRRHIARAIHVQREAKDLTSVQSNLELNIDEKDFLAWAFDGDLRTFLTNFIKINLTRQRFKRAKTSRFDETDRIVEYMFLNGEAYMDTHSALRNGKRRDSVPLGSLFPNPFWFDIKSIRMPNSRWHGLAGLRTLQLLGKCRVMAGQELLQLIHSLFGYEISVLRELLETFVAYSLIDVMPLSEDSERHLSRMTLDPAVSAYQNPLFVTEKGKVFINYLLTRPDILYFYALDTPMIDFLVKDATLVRACRDPRTLAANGDFYASAIPALVIFKSHISEAQSLDLKLLSRRRDGITSELLLAAGLTKSSLEQAIRLPRGLEESMISFVREGASRTDVNGSYTLMAESIQELVSSFIV